MPGQVGRSVLFVALMFAPALVRAEPVKRSPDPAADALPEGALVRVGTTRLRHAGSVINVVFAPDGKSLATCGNDALVRLWDAATGKEIRRFEGHKGSLEGLAFSPDGKTILSAGNDGIARLWDVATGKEVRQLAGHQGTLTAIFSPDGKTVATKGGSDATGRLWDAATGKELHTFKVARDTGSPLAFAPDGKTLAVVHPDFTLRLLDSTTAKEVQTFAGHGEALNSLDFSPDGKVLASAGGDGLARLWDVATGKEVRQLRGHEGVVCSVHFSPDGKLMATGGLDKTIRFWDAKTGEELRQARGHTSLVSEVAFSPDGKVLASAGWDYTVRLWDVATGKELPQSAGPGPVACAALSADGKLLVTGHSGNGVHLWDAATGKPRRALDFDGPVTAVALTPDGKYVAAANGATDFAVWDVATGKKRCASEPVKQKGIPRRRVPVLALSPEGRMLAIVGRQAEGWIDFHDAATGARLATSPARPVADPDANRGHSPPSAMTFAPDGRTLLTSSPTEGVKLYETATGKEARQLAEPSDDGLGGIAIAPDGRSLAVRTEKTIRVWEAATGGERRHWDVQASPENWAARAVALSAGVRLVAASSGDKEISVGPVGGGQELRTLAGHDGGVTALAFAGGGRLLSVSLDGTAFLWDAAKLLPERKGPPEKVEANAAWAGLDDPDPAKAFKTMARLEESPEAAVVLLRQRLKPAAAADPAQIARLIARLDDDGFEKREEASKALADLGPQAEKALRKAAQDPPSAEAGRRMKELLKKIEDGSASGGRLRDLRALEVLEAVATPEAKKLLQELAKGAAEAALTQEAKASLNRLTTGAAAP
jgi:WD40 repeat protein